MAFNYAVLIGYDWLALKAIRKKLEMERICLVSFVGCVISYNFGALLGGSTVRYRLYSAWGLSPLEIVRLVIMLAVTFWVGAMGLAGVIFLFVPLHVPAETGINPAIIRPLGAILLGACLLYLAVCAITGGRPFRIFRRDFALPNLPIAVAQTVVAGLDLVVAASCLYTLMPQESSLTFLEFLPNYLLAQVAAVLTHVPGGIGVLEVILLNLLHNTPEQGVFTSILVFRVIYYLLPLFFASVLLGLYELHLRRHETDAFRQDARRWFRAWLPTLLAYAVFFTGAVMCLSVVIPANPHFLFLLKAHIPLWLMEIAHVLSGLAGVLLLIVAQGLETRRKTAWKLAVFVICVSIICNLLKGADWPEALLLLAVLFPLMAARRGFGRRASLWRGEYPAQWGMAVLLVVGFALLVGLFISGVPNDSSVLLQSSYTANGPRILRTLAAEFALLALLFLRRIHAQWKKRPG